MGRVITNPQIGAQGSGTKGRGGRTRARAELQGSRCGVHKHVVFCRFGECLLFVEKMFLRGQGGTRAMGEDRTGQEAGSKRGGKQREREKDPKEQGGELNKEVKLGRPAGAPASFHGGAAAPSHPNVAPGLKELQQAPAHEGSW